MSNKLYGLKLMIALNVDHVQADLDELVTETVESEVSSINNSGINAQIEYLNRKGFTDADIVARLSAASADTLSLVPELTESAIDGVKRVCNVKSPEEVLSLLDFPITPENISRVSEMM